MKCGLQRNRMRKWLAIAALIAQMTAGVCMLRASSVKDVECARCCESSAMAGGALHCACCRVASPALPAVEASRPFTITPPLRPAVTLASAIAEPNAAEQRSFYFSEPFSDTSPPRLYVRNSTLLI